MPEPGQTDAESMAAERKVDELFARLVHDTVKIPNPQYQHDGEPGEARLAKFVCAWLDKRKLEYECDLKWGVHAAVTGPAGPGAPGVLLAARMDSDHLDISDLAGVRLDLERQRLVCPGEVGLDCKTGVAIALSVLDRLQRAEHPGAWQVHVLFTVGEESGQKGAIRAPLARLLGGRVRLGVVIDRMTSGSGCPCDEAGQPVRHAVREYKGVPLLEPRSGEGLLKHLNAGHAAALQARGAPAPAALPLCVSPNCADAVELRGRWDAEVIAPSIKQPSPALIEAVGEYNKATRLVSKEMGRVAPEARVSGMNAMPRIGRYKAMRKVYEALHEAGADKAGNSTFDPTLAFSVVNLSYDYDDAWDMCDLQELDLTAHLLQVVCVDYFSTSVA